MTKQHKRLQLARNLGVSTVVFGVLFYALGGMIKPGYSSLSNFISELNATGTPWATQLGYFGFIPLGVLFATFLIVARPFAPVQGASRVGWWLLWSQPIAFIGVALAPCDVGCPLDGSTSQSIHNMLSVVTYFCGALGIFLLSYAPALAGRVTLTRNFLRITGVSFIVLFVVMLSSDPEIMAIRGLLQRFADGLLAISILTLCYCVLSVRET